MNNLLTERSESLKRPLVLDGAMGSLLQMKGIPVDGPLWSAKANLEYSNEVFNIHKMYIESGADIITTNTFRTNPYAVKFSGSSNKPSGMVKSAVDLAREASLGENIIIAGSNAPAEDCYKEARNLTSEELYANHVEQIDSLAGNGVDVIWNETFSHLDEIKIVCEYCCDQGLEYTINLLSYENLRILSGEKLADVLNVIRDYNPAAIGFNCISPIIFDELVKELLPISNWGFYLNCGSGNYSDDEITTGIYPEAYKKVVEQYLQFNPLYIGSCCGSTPEHTKYIKELLLEVY